MKNLTRTVILYLSIALLSRGTSSLKHHLVLTNDHRVYFSVSSFGYLFAGRLDVIVQNLSLSPDPSDEDVRMSPQFGFMLIKSDQMKNPYPLDQEESRSSCMLNDPRNYFSYDFLTMSLDVDKKKVLVRCMRDNKLPSIAPLPRNTREGSDGSHSSYIHTYNKRAILNNSSQSSPSSIDSLQSPKVSLPPNPILLDRELLMPETQKGTVNFKLHKCPNTEDLPLVVTLDDLGRRSYAFNFTMFIKHEQEEGLYYLTFHNCNGRRLHNHYNSRNPFTHTIFNLSMLIYETNYPSNYLSAGVMPLPQMYFVLSVMFFLIGCIWVNFIARQKESTLKIHYLMTILVFAKSCSLLFHGINYHYIALNGQPVVTWAYLYYATRSFKGALFFITLALIGSGWSFIKHILSDKDKKIIIVIVGLQVIAHVAEIVLDESTEGEASNEFWAELCSMVDLFSCVAILYPISWSVKHLEEASRTDGKAAINLKKLELFKRFYIISTIYIYVTRIVSFVFLSMLSYRYSWLAELVSEFSTLIYFIITGYYFQPMPTNPYLLLSSDMDFDEDILFSVDATENHQQLQDISEKSDQDRSTLLDTGDQKVTRRVVEDLV